MEHFIMDTDGINCLASQLGCTMEGTFYISEECEETLEQLIGIVEREGPSRTNTRRRLGMLELVTKTLIPLISALDAEENEEVDAKAIFHLATRLLMYLTQPSESICVPPGKAARHASVDNDAEMQDYLWQYKNAFLEKNTLPTFFTHIQAILDEAKDGQLTSKDCETVNIFLLIVRNIIFSSPQEVFDSKYADIILLRLLFQAGLADMIVRLVLMEQHVTWCAAIVQILSLIYKHRVSTEVKDFMSSSSGRTWLQTNMKSNSQTEKKSKHDRCDMSQKKVASNSSGSTTSTVTNSSESWLQYMNEEHTDSQNGGSSGGNEADCSYTGSSEDKLDEGVEATLMQIETKLCLTLNDFRVRQEQVMFTCTMLKQNVFNRLIEALNDNLMFKNNVLPDVYFMWLIVHFLRVAQQGDMQFDKIKSCLTVDMVSYLTYAGVSSMEELTVAGEVSSDSSVFPLRRYHLALLAIQEVINTIHCVRLQEKSPDVKAYIGQLTEFLLNMRDLRNLLLLTIRRYRPVEENNLFLRDAVMLNHNFLSLAEHVSSESGQIKNFNMLEHVRGFATTEVMAQYGSLLENYHSNSPLLNDCVFTMMHHIAGDCGAPQTLMQLPILSAFSDIWDDIHDLPQECQDLIHFTLDNFLTQAKGSPYECAEQLYGNTASADIDKMDGPTTETEDRESLITAFPLSDKTGWSEQESDDLFMTYQDFVDEPLKGSIGQITKSLEDKGIVKSEKEVLLQLYELNLCSEQEILEYTMGPEYRAETGMDCDNNKYSDHQQPMLQDEDNADKALSAAEFEMDLPMKDVESFVCVLIECGHSEMLAWVQMVLLETCYVKLGGRRISNGRYPEEAVPLHYTLRNKSVPLVTYTERQEEMLHDPVFMFLMENLGLHFSSDTGRSYPCIPNFWTPADLLNAAKKLGDINFEEQKFCESQVTDSIDEHLANIHKALISYSSEEQSPPENKERMSSLWNTFIQQCNINIRQNNAAQIHRSLTAS